MKRSSILIMSLGVILVVMFSSFSTNGIKNNEVISLATDIRYQVTVNLPVEMSLCNRYLVQILDGNQRLVAPAQVFIPGKSIYWFYEKGPVLGVRSASMVIANFHENFICEQELFITPDISHGAFLNGRTYFYQLTPHLTTSTISVK